MRRRRKDVERRRYSAKFGESFLLFNIWLSFYSLFNCFPELDRHFFPQTLISSIETDRVSPRPPCRDSSISLPFSSPSYRRINSKFLATTSIFLQDAFYPKNTNTPANANGNSRTTPPLAGYLLFPTVPTYIHSSTRPQPCISPTFNCNHPFEFGFNDPATSYGIVSCVRAIAATQNRRPFDRVQLCWSRMGNPIMVSSLLPSASSGSATASPGRPGSFEAIRLSVGIGEPLSGHCTEQARDYIAPSF